MKKRFEWLKERNARKKITGDPKPYIDQQAH